MVSVDPDSQIVRIRTRHVPIESYTHDDYLRCTGDLLEGHKYHEMLQDASLTLFEKNTAD